MKLAMVQMTPRLGDVDANLEQIEQLAARAASDQTDLAVFPELALTGYRLRDLVPHVAISLTVDSEPLTRLKTLSKTVSLIVGLVEETDEHRFFNSAVHFEQGRIVHVHRKCYLPTYGMFDEAMDFAEGHRLEAYDCALGRLGILICEDAWHPAAATVLTQDGARVLIIVSASPLRGLGAGAEVLSQHSWHELSRTLARFHTSAVVWVNRTGFEDGLAFAGSSFAVGPTGHVLAEAASLEPAITSVEVDPDAIRSARAAYPLVRDERPQLISSSLERVVRRRASKSSHDGTER